MSKYEKKKGLNEYELVERLIKNIDKTYNPVTRKIKIEKPVTVIQDDICENDEPCSCVNPEEHECNCRGLYFGDCLDFDVDMHDDCYDATEEKQIVDDCYEPTEKAQIVDECERQEELLLADMWIEFENPELPSKEEIVSSTMFYNKETGKQMLELTIKPTGCDTYIPKFICDGFIGKIYYVNDNLGVKESHKRALLTEGGLVEAVYCSEMVARNDKKVVDLTGHLEYNVVIEL